MNYKNNQIQNTNKPKNVIEENNEKEKKDEKFNMNNQISKKLFIVHDNNKSEKIKYMKTTI